MFKVYWYNMGKIFLVCLFFVSNQVYSQIDTVVVDVNFDVKHIVGNIDYFDRKKFINLHSDITEQEWDGNNFTDNLRDYFLNGFDVYMGRNTGGITWYLNNLIEEDPSRPGFANPESIESYGKNARESYGAKTLYHGFESRNEQVIAAQLHPFWPDGTLTQKGWAFSQENSSEIPFGTATGEYMGLYIKNFYGNGGSSGQNRPDLVEVINEPIWHLVDYGNESPEKVFEFHNAVASQIRKYNENIKIGGYCTAFPDHEKNNFQEWETRWKLFMDIAGENMDFWSIHLYDFPAFGGKKKYRKGAQMEATFDLMEQYSFLSFGEVKPFVISEFGAQTHDYWGPWSPYRDWLIIKSVNSMLLQFMERPNLILKAIPFIVLKAEWGYDYENDRPYVPRLLRKANEPSNYTGEWVFSDLVKIYEFWSNVSGIRVDSKTTDVDLMSDAYVDGNKAYVIINNLDFDSRKIKLNLQGVNSSIESIIARHLHLVGEEPVISETDYDVETGVFEIDPEATLLFEFEFSDNISVNDSSTEVKYYASECLQPITANSEISFDIENVKKGSYGEAILRLGIGRAHGKSLFPEIYFNGEKLSFYNNYRGDDQQDRDSFFGVLEVPVDYSILKESNDISVIFEDDGGYISSVALQVFEFSRPIERSQKEVDTGLYNLPESKIEITPNPANDMFTISLSPDFLDGIIEIYNLSGKKVLVKELHRSEEEISVSHLPKGIYVVRFISDKEIKFNEKLVVN